LTNLLRIATRGSALALAQTKLVADTLTQHHPELDIQVVEITTAGDRDRISPLWKMTGSGFFTTQVEQALLDNAADIAVHSFKDLPTQMTDGLMIAAVYERTYAEDVLVSKTAVESLDDLARGAVVGTSSPRRIAQLKHFRPELKAEPIRGNVQTRIDKVTHGDYDAVILARAGLERLGLSEKISFIFDPTEFVPAPAQGALAIQCRSDDHELIETLSCLNHATTQLAVMAERKVFSAMEPGCHTPAGVFASVADHGMMIVHAIVSSLDGTRIVKETIAGSAERSDALADELIDRLFAAGIESILKEIQ
jgi:hydroxymethylbilane synthase